MLCVGLREESIIARKNFILFQIALRKAFCAIIDSSLRPTHNIDKTLLTNFLNAI